MHKYNISSRTTEPHHPQQNPDKRQIQFQKNGTNTIIDQTGAPRYVWMYYLYPWVGISNYLAEPSHGKRSNNEIDFDTTPDISKFMHYNFLYPVYYYDTEEKNPGTKEKFGHWLGPTQHCSDTLT